MKKRTVWICALVIYLLVVCLILSWKIDNEMQNQVIIRPITVTEKSTGVFSLSVDCLFPEYPATALFRLSPGTGWHDGLRVSRLEPQEYRVDPVLGSVEVLTTKDMQVIRHAAHYPRPGEKARVVQQSSREDEYLLLYQRFMPPWADTEGFFLMAENETARLLSVADGGDPFMEDQAQERLNKMEFAFWRIYSLRDVERFLEALPMLAGVAAILWAMLVLGVQCCAAAENPEQRRTLRYNAGLEALLMLALTLLLGHICLPNSLLPKDSILNFRFYARELDTILKALGQLGQERQLFTLKRVMENLSVKILLAGFSTPLLWWIGWGLTFRKMVNRQLCGKSQIEKN